MFKDPEFKEETPYDNLDLDPSATPAEVNGALAAFMKNKRNVSRLPKAKEAWRKLKDPRERSMVDLWFYDFDTTSLPAPPLDVDEICKPPVFAPESLDSDLESPGPSPVVREIRFKQPAITDLPQYDGWDTEAARPLIDS
ncbi:MAG TPA: hypothetical protein VKU01_04575 [Bryobacteraceae bacterium]|nr:hypothetical protein [Bryobacteraceae bacterium]